MTRFPERERFARAGLRKCPNCLRPDIEFNPAEDLFAHCNHCSVGFQTVVGYDLFWCKRVGIHQRELWKFPGYAEDLRFTACAVFVSLN